MKSHSNTREENNYEINGEETCNFIKGSRLSEGALPGWSDRMAANPNMTIEDLRSLFDEWEKPTLEPEDVTYKTDSVGGVDVIWAFPIGCDKSKVLIYTHGGGFAVGSSSSHRKLAGHMAKALGVSAVVLDYRRAPEHHFPVQLEDAAAVYQSTCSHPALRLRISVQSVTLLGET